MPKKFRIKGTIKIVSPILINASDNVFLSSIAEG